MKYLFYFKYYNKNTLVVLTYKTTHFQNTRNKLIYNKKF